MISIIVPVYNVESYLKECVSSILGQTYKDIEVILVDDGSTDGCAAICDEFAKYDARITVIHKENGGLVSARKSGLKATRGEVIGFVDGDDWIAPNMFERLYKVLLEQCVSIAMCGRFEDSEEISKEVYHGIPEGRYDKEELLKYVYPNMMVNKEFFEWGIFPGVWDKLFRRELLQPCLMEIDERITMGEDAACVYPCLLNADSIYILHECLYHYRQSSGSMVRAESANYREERERYHILYTSVRNILKGNCCIYDARSQWEKYVLFLMLPRADVLYRGILELDYLFPFHQVKKGSRVVLYGMGLYGQRLYAYLKKTAFCRVVGCSDKNWKFMKGDSMPLIDPEKIGSLEYDYIVVTVSFAGARKEIVQRLSAIYPEDKIVYIDEKIVRDKEVLEGFGLI